MSSLTLTHHLSLSSVVPGKNTRPYFVSAQKWCKYIFAERSTLPPDVCRRRECCLWIRPWFSSTAHRVLFVFLEWLVRWQASVCTAVVLWVVASKIHARQHSASNHIFLFGLCPSAPSIQYYWHSYRLRVFFNRIDQITIRSIDCHKYSMLSLGLCWYHDHKMRYCCLPMRSGSLILEAGHLGWNCYLFVTKIRTPFCWRSCKSCLL